MKKPLLIVLFMFALTVGIAAEHCFDGPPPCNPRVEICPPGQ